MGRVLRLAKNIFNFSKTAAMGAIAHRRRARGRELSLSEKADWLHETCVRTLQGIGITFRVEGPLPAPGLIVSNHLSYLDILIFSAAVPCIFVSKLEVKSWPIFGKLADLGGTVYIDRTRRSDTQNAIDEVRNALQQGLRVVVFPEGTTSDGSQVLPFHASLFGSVTQISAPVTAAYLGYTIEDGSVGEDIAYWGKMTFFPHFLKLLSRNGVTARLHFSDMPRMFTDRKVAAAEMREEVLRLRI